MTVLQKSDHNVEMTRDRIDLIKRTYCKGATDDEFQLFISTCKRTGLSPEARQVYAVKRWDSRERREVMQIQTSIDGYRLIAERTGKYAGQLGPFWCGEDSEWKDVWLDRKPPVAAKVGALRHDFKEPCWSVARFDAYKATKKDGSLTPFWANMGDLMIAKCAEAGALRKAFPQELSGLYTSDEMQQADNSHQAPPAQSAPAVEAEYSEPSKPDLPERTLKMLNAYAAHGVEPSEIETYLGTPLSQLTDDDFANLKELFAELREGRGPFLANKTAPDQAPGGVASKLQNAFGK